MSQTRRFGTLWNLFLSHISNPKLTHGRKTGGGSKQIRATARQIHGGSIKTDPTVATVADHGEFGLILSWVFWWFGLIFCWFWVNFVVDYERLKWVALVVIGCFSSSSFILLLLDYCVRWDAVFVLWICVSFAGLVNGERERIWMLREKKKQNIVIHSYRNRVYLRGYGSKFVNMHIFTATDVIILEENCVNLNTFYMIHIFTVFLLKSIALSL